MEWTKEDTIHAWKDIAKKLDALIAAFPSTPKQDRIKEKYLPFNFEYCLYDIADEAVEWAKEFTTGRAFGTVSETRSDNITPTNLDADRTNMGVLVSREAQNVSMGEPVDIFGDDSYLHPRKDSSFYDKGIKVEEEVNSHDLELKRINDVSNDAFFTPIMERNSQNHNYSHYDHESQDELIDAAPLQPKKPLPMWIIPE